MSAPAPGTYLIKSKARPDAFVGRHIVEDKSLNPKRVIHLPQGISPDYAQWAVERCADGERVILRTRGTPTVVINDRVFGVLLDVPSPEEWLVTLRENHGPNVYTIETASRDRGWVFPEEEEAQVEARPLRSTKSLPPQFPPTELWEFVPIAE